MSIVLAIIQMSDFIFHQIFFYAFPLSVVVFHPTSLRLHPLTFIPIFAPNFIHLSVTLTCFSPSHPYLFTLIFFLIPHSTGFPLLQSPTDLSGKPKCVSERVTIGKWERECVYWSEQLWLISLDSGRCLPSALVLDMFIEGIRIISVEDYWLPYIVSYKLFIKHKPTHTIRFPMKTTYPILYRGVHMDN